MRLCLLLAAVLTFAIPSLAAGDPPKRILFVGNSYTGQIRNTTQGLFAASPHRNVHLAFITPGGKTLEFHQRNAAALEAIRDGKWDFVVLQDQSQTPALIPDKFLAASRELNTLITKSGAHTAYYQTWGRRDGDPRSGGRFPNYESMQMALTASYRKAAKRDRATLVPVGEAWQRVRKERPALGRELYKKDGSHPSAKGAFLAACCFYARLTGMDPATVKFDGGLENPEAAYLRKIAWDTFRATAGNGVNSHPGRR